jgi:outer membrane receptor protein involved in Fe transport
MLQNNSANPALRLAIRAALTGGSLVASMGVANAQQAPASSSTSDTALAEVVVTGSRIAVPNESSISPVTFVSSVEIQQSGVTRVEDLLNQLPQVFADQGSNISNGADGTANINLRGLGSKRTLTLVNGDRLGPGSPLSGGASDVNMIPVELIDNIQILTGGASSTYGADAVAGVVNFVLNDHFEGVKLVADAGIYQNDNKNVEGVEDAISASGFNQAPNNVWTGAQRSLAFIAGLNAPDGNGNATFYATYRNVLPVLQSKYSYSACTLGSGFLGTGTNATGGKFTCGGSLTANPAHFYDLDNGTILTAGPGYTAVPFAPSSLYNYGALNYYQRPDERYTAGTFLHYDFNEHVTVYSQLMFMNDRSVAQIASSGDFADNGSFNCSNPYLAANASASALFGCTGVPGQMTNPDVLILYRNSTGGPRAQDTEYTDFHEVLGVKGKIDDVWSYDASYQYSMVDLSLSNNNYFSIAKLQNALDATGTVANPVCTIGPPCVPFNPFTAGGVTAAQQAYLYEPALVSGRITQHDVVVDFTGDFGKYGIQSPFASSGLAVNVGGEYRDNLLSFSPDEVTQIGDLAGGSGPTPPVSGGIIAREGFAEARLPILDDQFLAKQLDFETGYRYSSYNLGFKTNTFKFGVDWAPTSDVRVRGSFARAVRAPNIVELFAPSAIGLDSTYSSDPCAGAAPTFTLAQCERTGVLPSQYGHIGANPAGQYNGLLGGNTALKPETALTTSFGVQFTPGFLPNFRANIDYYDIRIENVIQSVGGAVILSQCGQDDLLCSQIHRGPAGTLWATTAGYITDTLVNVGLLQEKGIDFDLSYRYDIGAFGKISSNFVGTYISSFDVQAIGLNESTQYNCAGFYGETCSGGVAGVPVPHWRHRFATTWSTPWENLDITATWRYIGPTTLESLSSNPNIAAPSTSTIANGGISNTDAYLSSRSYLDLTAAIKVADKITLRLGCNNVLDKAPPLIGSSNLPVGTGNGNTFPQFYDALGRYVFGEVIAQF